MLDVTPHNAASVAASVVPRDASIDASIVLKKGFLGGLKTDISMTSSEI